MKLRLPRWLPPVLILGLPLGFVLLWGSGALFDRVPPGETRSAADATDRPRVRMLTLQPGDAPDELELTGTVVAERTVEVAAKIAAQVTALGAQEGDRVRAGALLARLDARDLDAQQAQAAAGLARAQAATGTAGDGIQAAEGARAQARARLTLAEASLRRVQALHAEGGVSDQALNEAQGEHRMARAALEQARRQRAVAEGQRREATAMASQATASMRLAATSRSYGQVLAPFDGLVVARQAELGTMTAPGQPLFRLEQGPFRLDVAVEEGLAGGLAPGAPVAVTLGSGGARLAGRVVRVVPAVDPASRTAIAKVRLPDHPALRSGMSGRARFEVGRARRLVLPEAALVRWYHLTNAFVVGPDGRAALRLVRLGAPVGAGHEVLAGLEPGERVVLDPPAGLRDGMRVEVTP